MLLGFFYHNNFSPGLCNKGFNTCIWATKFSTDLIWRRASCASSALSRTFPAPVNCATLSAIRVIRGSITTSMIHFNPICNKYQAVKNFTLVAGWGNTIFVIFEKGRINHLLILLTRRRPCRQYFHRSGIREQFSNGFSAYWGNENLW